MKYSPTGHLYNNIPYRAVVSTSLAALIILALGCISPNDSTTKTQDNNTIGRTLSDVSETDARFLVVGDTSIIFSRTDGKQFRLYSHSIVNKREKLVSTSTNDLFHPLLLDKNIEGLYDVHGNAAFRCTQERINEINDNKSFKWAASSLDGQQLIYQSLHDNAVYIYSLDKRTKTLLCVFQDQFHGFSFSQDNKSVAISYDNTLSIFDIDKQFEKILLSDESIKVNPFLNGNELYFAANPESDFYQIYSIDTNSHSPSAVLKLSKPHDLRLPKVFNDKLYFVEVINSEYLLNSFDLNTSKEHRLTTSGVVYDYQLTGGENMIISYSDIRTPRTIKIVNIKQRSSHTINSHAQIASPSCTLLHKRNLVPTYQIMPPPGVTHKAVIIYIHPGLNADFSPRWDNLLMSLCMVGYIVVAPNYRMSSGLGKKHSTAGTAEAVLDILDCHKYIQGTHRDYPIFFLSASSGNILLEQCLQDKAMRVNGSASICGIVSKASEKQNTHLFFMGKNDPIVNFNETVDLLRKKGIHTRQIRTFDDEGHWLRKTKNIETTVLQINDFFIEKM